MTSTFAHNPASQIVTLTRDNDSYAFTGHYNVDRAYGVNGLNQYTSAGPASFTYDANGNLTGDGSRTYVYDAENRLVSASNGAALAWDPLGRLFQTSGGSAGTTQFLYDGDALVAEHNGSGGLLRRYMHGAGPDEPLAWYEGTGFGSARLLKDDHQGSIVGMTDGNGYQFAINRYDRYGTSGVGQSRPQTGARRNVTRPQVHSSGNATKTCALFHPRHPRLLFASPSRTGRASGARFDQSPRR